MNTLFKSKVSRKSVQPDPEERIPKTIDIKSISHGQLLPIAIHSVAACARAPVSACSSTLFPRY